MPGTIVLLVLVVFGTIAFALLPAYGMGSRSQGQALVAAVQQDPWADHGSAFYQEIRLDEQVLHSWTEDSHASWWGGQALVVDPGTAAGLVVYGHVCGNFAMVGHLSEYVSAQRSRDLNGTAAGFFAYLRDRYPNHQVVTVDLPSGE